ncbi:MAG: metallophosphoesterase [Oligoflexia bacterium]|nr:metallophosphoesterase [Oligoflexia bacterium]
MYRIAHIGDLHLESKKPEDYSLAIGLFTCMQKLKANHIVVAGDISHRGEEEVFLYIKEGALTSGHKISSELSVVIGNHDLPGRHHYQNYFGKTFGTRILREGRIKLIYLDSTKPSSGEIFNHSGELNQEMMFFLEQELKVPPEVFIIVVMHHHLLDVDGDITEEMQKNPLDLPFVGNFGPLENAASVLELLEKHRVALALCGHTHHITSEIYGNQLIISTAGAHGKHIKLYEFDEHNKMESKLLKVCTSCNGLGVDYDEDAESDDEVVACADCEGCGYEEQ